MHSVFVVSRMTIYREGIAAFLAQQPDLEIAGSSERLDRDIGACDLCVLDMADHDPDAIALFFAAMRDAGTPIVVVGLLATEQQVLACIEAGASGYVTRDQSLDDLHQVVCQTLSNGACVRQCDLAAVLRRVRASCVATAAGPNGSAAEAVPLTKRERQVARLLSQSRSNREIARDLGISVHTVKHHVRSTLAKLGVERRGDAVALRGRPDILVD